MMVSSSHVEINLDVGYELHPEVGGEPGVSIRANGGGETVEREDSFYGDICSFDSCDVLRNWDEVGENGEPI